MSINKAALDQAAAARKQYRSGTPTMLYSIEGEDAVFVAAYLEAVNAGQQPDETMLFHAIKAAISWSAANPSDSRSEARIVLDAILPLIHEGLAA